MLTVHPACTRFIEGLGPLEADAILTMLLRHMQKPEFGYRHHWQVGDLLIWDQQAVQHYAVRDFSGHRLVHRISALATTTIYKGLRSKVWRRRRQPASLSLRYSPNRL
jgi:taurine dioxygenase